MMCVCAWDGLKRDTTWVLGDVQVVVDDVGLRMGWIKQVCTKWVRGGA